MGSLKPKPLVGFLFSLFFFVFSTLFHPSSGASLQGHLIHPFQARIPVLIDVNPQSHGIVEPNTRRVAAETPQNSTYLILAADRTHRRDPSDNFTYYTGGWNITNRHYISSVAFSAVGPIVVGIVWFLVFGIFLVCFCLCCCCCRRKTYGYSATAYVLSIICLTLFTLAALAGLASLRVGQEKFQDSIVDTVKFILVKADKVIVNLKDLLDSLLAAKNSSVGKAILPHDLQDNIEEIQKQINDVSTDFRKVTRTNSQEIRQYLDPMSSTLIGFATALLVLAFIGYVCSICGLQCIVYSLVIFGWILLALTFILSGAFLLVHNVVADTCVAMSDWLQNPTANSALQRIIPKVDDKTAEDISSVTKGVTFGLITMVNIQIGNISNADMPPKAGPLYYNQSGPLVPLLCCPYDSDLKDRKCAPEEVTFENAPQVWKSYVCETSAESGNCETTGRITRNGYDQMVMTANVSHALYTEMPFLVDLIDSVYLKELIGDINKDYCPKLVGGTRRMYSGFIVSSVAVMLSMILWMIYARERRHRKYTKKIDQKYSSYNRPYPM